MSSNKHTLLSRQIKRQGIDLNDEPPTKEQWVKFLERVDRAYTEADQERYLLERSQEISSREMQHLYSRIEESQHIASLGNWSFDKGGNKAQWSKECFCIF